MPGSICWPLRVQRYVVFGLRPVCPLGSIDFQSPYACGQAHSLLEAVRRAAETMAPQAWLQRMAPVEERLLNTWLPQFSEAVRNAAEKLSLPALPVPE